MNKNRPPDYQPAKESNLLLFYDAMHQSEVITRTDHVAPRLDTVETIEVVKDGEASRPEIAAIMDKLRGWGMEFVESYQIADDRTILITKIRLQETPIVAGLIQRIDAIRREAQQEQVMKLGGSKVASRLGIPETDERIKDLCLN